MKAFDSLGSWILDTRSGLVFGCLLMLATATILGYEYLTSAESVTISAKEWACGDTEPKGIKAECTLYKKVR